MTPSVKTPSSAKAASLNSTSNEASFPTLLSTQPLTSNSNQPDSPQTINDWVRILNQLDLLQLRSIRGVCRLFQTVYLQAKTSEERKIRCTQTNLPSEVWLYDIMDRLNKTQLKKAESLCRLFRNHVCQNQG